MTGGAHPTRSVLSFSVKLVVGLLGLIAMFLLSMLVGAADTTLREVWHALTFRITGDKVIMLHEIRMPRELAAAVVGAALAVAGAIMQGLTRNPLADPGLLGLTSGANAALAVTLAWFPLVGTFGIMTACFVGAACGAILVFGVASLRRGGFAPLRMVLAGTAISAFLYAITDGISLYYHISKDVSMWTAGGLIGTTWSQLQALVPFAAVGVLLAFLLSRQLTILSLQEEVAVGLGQRTALVKAALFVSVILLTGSAVALAGNLAFIGLMIPHLVRASTGTDYRRILPMSAVAGAVLMLAADTLARVVHAPYETPVVAIIAMMGLPFFLILVRKGGRTFP